MNKNPRNLNQENEQTMELILLCQFMERKNFQTLVYVIYFHA